MRFHRFTWFLLLVFAAPAIGADLAKPDCGAVARWAAEFDPDATYQVAPRVSLLASAGDEQMVALFGKPVPEWTKQDFPDFNQQLAACQKALVKTDRDTARRINVARKGFRGTAGAVRNLTLSAQRTGEAVDTLLALPATNDNLQILALAQSALNGEDIAGQIKTSPRNVRRPLSQIKQSYPNLASVQAEALVQRLSERSQEIQAGLDAKAAAEAEADEQKRQRVALEQARMQEQAAAELKAAREKLQTLPVAPDSTAALERLEQIEALEQVPPVEAAAFRAELAEKRQAVEAEVNRERTQRMAADLDERLQRLRDFEAHKLADLGAFWQMVVDFANLAKAPGNADALATVDYDSDEMKAFGQKFADSAAAMLPDFEQYLQGLPETAAGLQRVKTAVADATGVRMRSAALQSYYAAVQKRAQIIDAAVRHAAEWFSIEPRLQALLQGEEVDAVSIRGLRSGMAQARAVD